jgi:type I restriction enzyme, S subunit
MSWQNSTLGELAKLDGGLIQTGPFGSQLHQAEYETDGIPVVMPKDIADGRISGESVARVSEQTATRLQRHKLKPRSIVLPRRGEVTKRAYIREDQEGWICGTGCLKIELHGRHLVPEYLYYFIEQEHVTKWLLQHAVGTTMLNLSAGIVSALPIRYPSTDVQTAIAETLAIYDDLIENNRRRMALLEESARLLYREWFVRLRFPGYEHTPIVDGVPQGWTTGVVNDVVDVRSGFAFKTETYESDADFAIVTIKNVQDGEFYAECNSFVAEPPQQMPAHCYLQTSDILLSLTGNIGRSCHVIGDGYLLNQRVAKLVPTNDTPSSFCYFMFRSDEMKGQLSAISYGVAQQNLSPVKMGTLPFKIPSASLLRMFSDFAEPLVQQSIILKLQNQKLRAARDLLLPRLMSGELAV